MAKRHLKLTFEVFLLYILGNFSRVRHPTRPCGTEIGLNPVIPAIDRMTPV